MVTGLIFGVKAAVLAIVIEAGLRISLRALKASAMVGVAVAAFAGIFLFKLPFPLIVLLAGLAGWAGSRIRPKCRAAVCAG